MRRQVWYTAVLLLCAGVTLVGLTVVVSAQTHDGAAVLPSFTFREWLSIITLIVSTTFAAGSVREQFRADRERLTRIEHRLDIEIPTLYMRQDVYRADHGRRHDDDVH